MLRALALVAAPLLLVACGGGETTRTVTDVETETVTVTVTVAADPGLPEPVAEKRAAILAAAEEGDYDAVAALAADEFTYSFGGDVEGGPAAHWRGIAETTDERPLEILAAILKMPYTLSSGIYVWPFPYDADLSELTEYEKELLAPIADEQTIEQWAQAGNYLGWRAGIEPDGDWIFFVAGD